MNIFELLEQSNAGKNYAKKLKENIKAGYCYLYLPKIDVLLNKIEINQREILKKNFQSIKQTGQLLDKLVELLIAYKFLDQEPKFFDDNDGSPDIYLQKNNKYIEVKRINMSDKEKKVMNCLKSKPGQMFARNISSKLSKQSKGEQALTKKVKEQINKAIKQLNEKGIIYLVYFLDSTSHIKSGNSRKRFFEKKARSYLNLLNKRYISLEILHVDNVLV
jgi:hypothetical protein